MVVCALTVAFVVVLRWLRASVVWYLPLTANAVWWTQQNYDNPQLVLVGAATISFSAFFTVLTWLQQDD